MGILNARDDDGPQELAFSIPKGHVTEQYVRLGPATGESNSAAGRSADIILIKKLDRDFAVGIKWCNDQSSAAIITINAYIANPFFHQWNNLFTKLWSKVIHNPLIPLINNKHWFCILDLKWNDC